MILWIAADHAGFVLKESLKRIPSFTRADGSHEAIEWHDLGPFDETSTDYPLYAQKLVKEVLSKRKNKELLEPCGVLICGSGVGVSMAANRFEHIRAVLALNPEIARLSREHNASNVLCLGARFTQSGPAQDILTTWLQTPFAGGRHERRVCLIDEGKKKNDENC